MEVPYSMKLTLKLINAIFEIFMKSAFILSLLIKYLIIHFSKRIYAHYGNTILFMLFIHVN